MGQGRLELPRRSREKPHLAPRAVQNPVHLAAIPTPRTPPPALPPTRTSPRSLTRGRPSRRRSGRASSRW